MGKSRRNKKVSLTKVKAKGKEQKVGLIQKVQSLVNAYKFVYVV
jgi:hypothetical protein